MPKKPNVLSSSEKVVELGKQYLDAFKPTKIVKYDPDDDTIEITKKSLEMVLDLIPIAQSKYINSRSDRDSYALTNLVTQARELIIDLENRRSTIEVVQVILDNLIKPELDNLMKALSKILHDEVKEEFLAKYPNEQKFIIPLLKTVLKLFGEQVGKSHDKIRDDLVDYLR